MLIKKEGWKMEKEHKSIFTRIKEYKGNPIDEYKKISVFLSKKCYYGDTIFDIFDKCFKYSKLLSPNFVDLEYCLESYEDLLDRYSYDDYLKLEKNIQDDLLDAFLTYCEIILCMYYVTFYSYLIPKNIIPSSNFDKEIFAQLLSIITNSLKSMNYKIKVEDENNGQVQIIKNNPWAEMIASESPNDISQAIIFYLGARDKDIEEKESRLHNLIDLLEPTFKKYNGVEVVGKIKQYVQLIRHPKEKVNEQQYKWFFDNKSDYLDKLFSMCVFVQSYSINRELVNEFENNKKTPSKLALTQTKI